MGLNNPNRTPIIIAETDRTPYERPSSFPNSPEFPSPAPTPTELLKKLDNEKRTSKVRLKIVGDDGNPAYGVAVAILSLAEAEILKDNPMQEFVTDYSGEVQLEKVKCDTNIKIFLWESHSDFQNNKFKETRKTRYLKCDKGRINLGDIKISCICPDCRPNRVLKSLTGNYENKPCKPELNKTR